MNPNDKVTMRVIVNGKNADDPALQGALEQAKRQGCRIELRVTQGTGDATRFAAERPCASPEVIVAVGGDGTVNEVLNGMLTADLCPEPSLAIVPLGTANDFARSCAIAQDDPAEALQLVWRGEPQHIDVGRVNERFFINVATAGFGADVAAQTPAAAKKILGGAAYAVTGLVKAMNVTPYPARLIMPDERWEGELIVITVGNGRQAGGGLPVAPKAALDDGRLDLMVIHDIGLLQAAEVLSELRHMNVDEESLYLFYRQLPAFRLELDQEIRLDVDGEPIYDRAFDFTILHRRLRILLPPGTPLSWQ